MFSRSEIRPAGDFIAGKFISKSEGQSSGSWLGKSPADLSDETGEIRYSYSAIDQAVEAARGAFKTWKKIGLEERKTYLRRYQDRIKANLEVLAEYISREMGKPFWESKGEVQTMINKIDITLNEGLKATTDYEIPGILENTLGACRYRPLGVVAVIGPFNFPGHLPNGHIAPALLMGNTVIFKPSEKTPLVGQLMAKCMEEAGLPPGVFNLVQGEKEVGRRLCVHEGVDAILFTGSYEVGTRIKQDTLLQHWKLLALEMGGKNASIICADANLDVAVHECLTSAFLTTGQRCSATSRVLVHESLFSKFVEKLHLRSKEFKIGYSLDDPFMGPLIDSSAVDRYLKFLGIATREGFETVMRGKALELERKGYYVTPSICTISKLTKEAMEKSIYQQTELFAPNVSVIGFSDLEEAIELANGTQYGLVGSIFTSDKANYLLATEELETGLINWNKSTVGASSKLPFGGLKKSGNHFPTAVTAGHYCSVPVSSLEVANPVLPKVFSPGLKWD